VIFGFRELRSSPPSHIPADFGEVGFAGGLKLRVVWTINALIAAGRTPVPSVRLRMRHVLKLEVEGGAWMGGATLVIMKPTSSSWMDDGAQAQAQAQQQTMEGDVEDEEEKDAELALEAFGGGVYGEAVRALVNTRGYLLEMNSF
jgi:hypothetical protein